jgi:hypothetical protein
LISWRAVFVVNLPVLFRSHTFSGAGFVGLAINLGF